MKKSPEPAVIRANVRLMRLEFELPQGIEQCAYVHAT